jgi:MoaA/NifB/PqqE/SkfB family radical SAM enzyme
MTSFLRTLVHLARGRLAALVGAAPPGPLMVFVEVTRRCNLRCRHCDIWQTAARDPQLVARELAAAELLGVLRELRGLGLLAVDLFGGEPLLRPDLEEIVRGARALGLHVTVTTNGWLLDPARADALAAAGVSQVLVSLDGSHAALHDGLRGRPGAFARAVAGLQHVRLRAPAVHVGVDVVVSRANVDDLPALVDLVADLGLDTLRFLPYHACYPFERFSDAALDALALAPADVERLRGILPAVRARLRERDLVTNADAYLDGVVPWFEGRPPDARCAAGVLVCDINAAGDVFGCYPLEDPVGNVRAAPFAELWRREPLRRHRRRLRAGACDRCWQSCYVEPALRTDPRVALREPRGLLREVRRYLS